MGWAFFKKRTMKHFFSFIILITNIFLACNSDNGSAENNNVPQNLQLTANVVGTDVNNPNGDGSGVVQFSFSAENATNYKLNVGNGQVVETQSNTHTYTYTGSGISTYEVFVSAYNGTNFISKSITITVFVASSMIWAEEFNVNGAPNSAYWSYDLGTGDNGWGNSESQYYTNRSENVIVEDGHLKIKLIKENYNGSQYTSARIKTQHKFSFQYGKVEIRAKLPSGGGTWPALWMLGNNITTAGWPGCGEIDIMEHVGNSQNLIHGTLHHPGHSGGNGDGGSVTVPNVSSEFHLYTVDWRASSIKFYVDNQLFYTFPNHSNLPFNQNFFLIINCAMGGNFGGAIDPNFTQSVFEVDYVRIYQ